MHEEQLSVTFVPWGISVAGTEPDSHFVPTIHVNDGEVLRWGFYGARITVMPKITNKSKRVEGGPVEEPAPPVLRQRECDDGDGLKKLTYFQAMQW